MASSRLIPALSKSVLVTGASSGLGRAAAIHLSQLGFRVFAGVRAPASAAELSGLQHAPGSITPVMLDVTDAAAISAAGDFVDEAAADTGLWGLVNNAGVAITAPLECVSADVLRTQLETNVIGALAVSQRFLPALRASRGRIVNVSSGLGSVALPYLGVYAAAQFAKEGMSDALRRELRPLGVSVSVVHPAVVPTPIWGKMRESADAILAAAPADVVDVYRASFIATLQASDARVQASRATPAEFTRAVVHALTAERPKIRYRVGAESWSSTVARRMLPDRVLDALLSARH
jgi:NAD(P)-dependent dehydrogenase (short-subunit alcohol dehydrogenase family)